MKGERMRAPRKKTTRKDLDFFAGQRAAYSSILSECARVLRMGGGREEQRDADLAALLAERARVVSALRRLCAEVGDNDWQDDEPLWDVIAKHVAPHLAALVDRGKGRGTLRRRGADGT